MDGPKDDRVTHVQHEICFLACEGSTYEHGTRTTVQEGEKLLKKLIY
jgi:hypothetical protein